jgi:hypothetical protein
MNFVDDILELNPILLVTCLPMENLGTFYISAFEVSRAESLL